MSQLVRGVLGAAGGGGGDARVGRGQVSCVYCCGGASASTGRLAGAGISIPWAQRSPVVQPVCPPPITQQGFADHPLRLFPFVQARRLTDLQSHKPLTYKDISDAVESLKRHPVPKAANSLWPAPGVLPLGLGTR
jgi:hypothetical protein